jgi:hypothetical protein
MTFTTVPSPVIQDSSATLFYTSTNLILLPGLEYGLKDTSGNAVSTYTAPDLSYNFIAPNINNNYPSSNSSCFYAPNGDIYTSMENSSIAGNGLIQITSNGVSSVYLQFDNSGNPPIPSNYYSPQYPTGVTMDSNGYLYFLVFGDNNLYKINNINDPTDPSNNLSQYNTNPAVISAPFELTITPNNYFYITDTQSPYNIQQIDTTGNATAIPNYTAGRPAYGITSDLSSNLYIGYDGGVIGKYDLTTQTFTDNFITLPGEGSILGLVFINSKNVIVANTTATNIYVISLLNNNYLNIITNSGILGGFGTNNINSIYGTTSNGMVQYIFDSVLIFNNLYLTNIGNNVLTVNNLSTSIVLDTINVNVTTLNATGYYYGGLQTGTDLINIFQPLSLGSQYYPTTGYTTDISGNSTDFNLIFASLSSPGAIDVSYNVGWKVGSQDLSQIFAAYNPIIYEISNQNGYLTSTPISGNGYTGLIFENNTIPSSSPNNGTCNITFLVNKTITFLVVGGGGGGGAGYSPQNCAGAGAGGSSFVYQTTSVTANSQFSLQVGFAGLGRQATNPGYGGSTGNTGGNSFVSSIGINFTANGGAGGKGVGTAQGYAGGVGGSSVNNLVTSGGSGGGGGGSGGGASADPTGAACNSGSPGNLNTSFNQGGQGGTGITTTGGTGGNCYNSTSVSLPFTSTASTVYFGNGGGGGANSTGGLAGSTTGGVGSGASDTKGQNAINGLISGNYYYGNGGGGGAQSGTNWGGSGANGVVMVWWQN